MRTETVDEMLQNYREYAARCAYLECAIKEAKKLLVKVRASAVSDAISVTQHYSDMPGGKGGASDPTASIAARIADGYQSDRELALKAEIAGMEDELRDKTPTRIRGSMAVRTESRGTLRHREPNDRRNDLAQSDIHVPQGVRRWIFEGWRWTRMV